MIQLKTKNNPKPAPDKTNEWELKEVLNCLSSSLI
jgi:hypothetical protein